MLDYFKGKKDTVIKLRSGMKLSYCDGYLFAQISGISVRVAKLSKACMESINGWLQRGYYLCNAIVRFVVAWKGQDDTEETAVLLPDIQFAKGVCQ